MAVLEVVVAAGEEEVERGWRVNEGTGGGREEAEAEDGGSEGAAHLEMPEIGRAHV